MLSPSRPIVAVSLGFALSLTLLGCASDGEHAAPLIPIPSSLDSPSHHTPWDDAPNNTPSSPDNFLPSRDQDAPPPHDEDPPFPLHYVRLAPSSPTP